jgi:hypothetical protein
MMQQDNLFPTRWQDFNKSDFEDLALETFRFQYAGNRVYRSFCDLLRVDPEEVTSLARIPFLPISFFKSHRVVSGTFPDACVFESSGTTQSGNSRHHVKSLDLYRDSFMSCFRLFFGDPADWCILSLLPSYLERGNSSLVMMADALMEASGHPQSGFYLDQFDRLHGTLQQLESGGQKTILLGVTFALLDFSEQHPMDLHHTIVMETGGMKGRKREMTREEVHAQLKLQFGLASVHAEYGMTELLSQAYSFGDGLYRTPPWMRVLLREEDDPLSIVAAGNGAEASGIINIIDLANRDSCAFIATDDLGRLHKDGSFEVIGRIDNSDIRGCSLMVL